MKLSRFIVKLLLLVLFAIVSSTAYGQEKEYYLGHHAVSLEYSFFLRGIQADYRYIINPKAKLMWMPKIGIGQSPEIYYTAGLDFAYGGKNRLVLGVRGYYNLGRIGSEVLASNLSYLHFGKKRMFYSITFRLLYSLDCDCLKISPFFIDSLFSLGWKF